VSIPAEQTPQFSARSFWLKYWLPALAWQGVIAIFSTRVFGAGRTGIWLRLLLEALHVQVTQPTFETLHYLWRKGAHFFAYGVLSLLMFRALRGTDLLPREWKLRYLMISFFVCVLTAIVDETHQYFTPGRTGNPNDVLLDSVAAAFVQMVILFWIQVRAGARTNSSTSPEAAANAADR
jgi:VanZ family protein